MIEGMTLALGTLQAWHRHVMESGLPRGRDQVTDAERVAMLEVLEELKNTICAVQGDLAVDLDTSQRAQPDDRDVGWPTRSP